MTESGSASGRAPVSRRARVTMIAGLVVPCIMLALSCGAAQARIERHNGHVYGVFLKNSSNAALAAVRAKGEGGPPLQYQGGPVMLSSHLYAIFWGPSGSFAPSYENTITQYMTDLQTDSGKLTNDMSVSTQYCQGVTVNASSCPTGSQSITTSDTFVTSVNDTTAYPAKILTCTGDPTPANPCLMDSQLQGEIARLIAANSWETDPPGAPVAQYILFTPQGVDSCDGPGSCTYSPSGGFCGYHSDITNVNGSGNVAVYSNMPYESGCDSGNAPGGVSGNVDADGALDTLVHELNESATDPEPATGWVDSGGQEIGDKCQNGPINNDLPIGGSPTATPNPTLYNQLINGHQYYTQTLYSNEATQTPASTTAVGCLERLGPTPVFLPPTGVAAGQPETWDASNSYDVASTITSYVWNFGDGTGNVSGAQVTHTFAAPGTYGVTLTVNDSTNNPSTETMSVTVPQLLISQLRPGVSASKEDSYVELYNPTSAPVSLTGWALVTIDQNFDITQTRSLTGAGSVGPGGYYLEGGGNYSLGSYAALDDSALTGLLPNTTVLLEDSSGNVDDAACMCGSTLSATGLGAFGGAGQYAFVRQLHTGHGGTLGFTGTPQFTGNNLTDFALVRAEAANVAGTVLTSYEGSPGPHDSNSPGIANPNIGVSLLSGTNASAQPNQQVVAGGPTPAATETLFMRRTITNNTGAPITALRFRVSDITTGSTPAPPSGQAILRVVSDPGGSTTFSGTTYPLTAISLDAPASANADGGGLNASLTVPSVTPGAPLAVGGSINVEFKLGVQRGGHFAFFFNTEATG